MAGTLKDATRNAILADVIAALGSTGSLEIFSGAPTGRTAGVFNADPTGLLATIALPSVTFGTPSAGSVSIANGPWLGTATGGSNTPPASFRLKTTAGGGVGTVVWEGTAGVGSGDLQPATNITSGQVLSVGACTLTAGN